MNGQREFVEGTHMSVKLKRWKDAASAALEKAKQRTDLERFMEGIKNCHEAIFFRGLFHQAVLASYPVLSPASLPRTFFFLKKVVPKADLATTMLQMPHGMGGYGLT